MTTIQPSPSCTEFLESVCRVQSYHARGRAVGHQKAIGQFFTPPPIARLMASMLDLSSPTLRLLDPGAGIGVLSAAVCERIADEDRPPCSLQIHAYETDPDVLPALDSVLTRCQSLFVEHGHSMEFEIHAKDFVLDGPILDDPQGLFGPSAHRDFDLVIMNPPYLKLARDSDYARKMVNIVHGQPNLYALFMALGASVLRDGGQFVSITPRSFTNGPYFRAFRKWFLSHMTIRRLHLFESRREVFPQSKVLQENIITSAVRQSTRNSSIAVSSTPLRGVPSSLGILELPASLITDHLDDHNIIRIPTSEDVAEVMRTMEAWPHRFSSLGLRVSTGPVVMFRADSFIHRGTAPHGSIPLLAIQNVHPFQIVWPVQSEHKTLSICVCPESEALLVPNSNYVLIRRFSAKEEERRLTAAALLATAFPGPWLALENHLNYVYHGHRPLTPEETLGITALCNSRLLDIYFRAISGNTQVNAAEIRSMPFPDLETLADLGAAISALADDVSMRPAVERVVLSALGINGRVAEYLLTDVKDQ